MERCVLVSSGKDPYILITNRRSWERCLKELQEAPRIAVDLEANGLYAYREKICLIQISTDRNHFIVDPLAGFSLEGLKPIFADESVEKVFHAVDYDLTLLQGLYRWKVRGLFDTMRAAEILGHTSIGLASLLGSFYGLTLSKKYQKANWGLRPLSREHLLYAYNDTCHLLRLRDDLATHLVRENLMEEAREAFEQVCHMPPAMRVFDPDHFWKIPGALHLDDPLPAVLKALFIFRESEAQKQDVPSFKIMSNKMLAGIIQQVGTWHKTGVRELVPDACIPLKLLERYRAVLMKTIQAALLHLPPPRISCQSIHTNGFWQRLEKLKEWRKNEADGQGVQSNVVLTRAAMTEIAERNPGTLQALSMLKLLGPVYCRKYGPDILEVLRSASEEAPSNKQT